MAACSTANSLAASSSTIREQLAALEKIVHPAVRDARASFIEEHRDAPALLFEIPLLFETGGETDFDKVVVVSAPPEVQRARVLARAGMTEDKLDPFSPARSPTRRSARRADFVIDTGADLSTTESAGRAIFSLVSDSRHGG